MLDQRPHSNSSRFQIVASVNFDSSISARGSQKKLLILAASYMYVATRYRYNSLLVLHKDFLMAEFKFMQVKITFDDKLRLLN